MMKPYQNDLDFLNEELEHHKYILRKYTQEGNKTFEQEFKQQCRYILTAIEFMESRQATATAEWTALSENQRKTILLPLIEALDQAVTRLHHNSCLEFSIYLENYLTGYFTDLIDCKEA